jgi:hypothetical protein
VSKSKNDCDFPFCHSGLDPESSALSSGYISGCRIRHSGPAIVIGKKSGKDNIADFLDQLG